MRLLMTTDTVGGVWTFTSELTRQLLERGHTVHLVSFGRAPSTAQQGWVSSQTQDFGRNFSFQASDIPLEWMQANDRTLEQGEAFLQNELQQHGADLIVSNQFCFGRLATNTPRIVVGHSDVLSWARACKPSALAGTPWLNRYTSMVQGGLLDAAAVVTPTASMGKALTTSFFLPRNYVVIPNGISVAAPPSAPPERKLQAITAGRLWDEAKGLDTLHNLAAPMPLLVAGDNTLELNDGGQQQPWPEHLTNLGALSQPDLHQHFRESAVYLCASRYEPFGLAPLEAALCGCAVVARDLPSLREVWADSALFFKDEASLGNTLQALASDPNLLAQLQARAHQRASLFTPERMADSYLRLFQAVLEQPPATSQA